MESLRVCNKCGESFLATIEFFHKEKGGVLGLRSDCKSCHKKQAKYRWNTNRNVRLEQGKKYAHNNPERIMWLSARRRARNEELPFTIKLRDVSIPSTCPIYNVPLILRDKDWAPTLDKIIPELGYIPGNVEVISRKANRLKNNGVLEDFKKLVGWLEQKQTPEVDFFDIWERAI